MKMAVDIGYSSVKGVSEQGKVLFPSVISPISENLLAGAVGGTVFKHHISIQRAHINDEYLVGDAALASAAASGFLAQREKPEAIHDLLLLTAAYLLSNKDQSFVQLDLSVGLPLAYYKAQREALKNRLTGDATWVSVDGGKEICLQLRRIAVFPQGAGALIAAGELPPGGLVALLDIGSYTTDYLVFEIRGGQPVPVSECCGSIEAGVSLVSRALADEFQKQTGAPLPLRLYETVLERARAGKPVIYQGNPIDLNKAYSSSRAQIGNLIASNAAAFLRDRAGFVVRTFLAGGGSFLFEQEIAKVLPCTRVIEDPVFANANGFLTMLTGNGKSPEHLVPHGLRGYA